LKLENKLGNDWKNLQKPTAAAEITPQAQSKNENDEIYGYLTNPILSLLIPNLPAPLLGSRLFRL
jgi:hypothetical protein